MRTYKNLTKSPRGVVIKGGETVMIDPGKTSQPLDVADADHAIVEKLGWFEVGGGAAAKTADPEKPLAPPTPEPQPGATADPIKDGLDELEDADLADLYTGLHDGKAPHHNAKRETIIAAIRTKQASQTGEAEAV